MGFVCCATELKTRQMGPLVHTKIPEIHVDQWLPNLSESSGLHRVLFSEHRPQNCYVNNLHGKIHAIVVVTWHNSLRNCSSNVIDAFAPWETEAHAKRISRENYSMDASFLTYN